jgi:hypothetical protein
MNVEIGNEVVQFHFWEYMFNIFSTIHPELSLERWGGGGARGESKWVPQYKLPPQFPLKTSLVLKIKTLTVTHSPSLLNTSINARKAH